MARLTTMTTDTKEPTMTTETTLSTRRDVALLDLREIARVFDGLTDDEARRAAQDALHHKLDLALGNGATMAQVADVLHGGAHPDTEVVDRPELLVQLRGLIGEVAGSAGRIGPLGRTPSLDALIGALGSVLAANRELVDELIADREAHHDLARDVAAMRRVLGLAS